MEQHYTLRVQPYNIKHDPYIVCGFWRSAAAAREYVERGIGRDVIISVEQAGVCA